MKKHVLNNKTRSQAGALDILTAMSILGVVLVIGFYMTLRDTNAARESRARLDSDLDATLQFMYETTECCRTLAPYAAFLEPKEDGGANCAAINANTFPLPSSLPITDQDKSTIIARNELGADVLKLAPALDLSLRLVDRIKKDRADGLFGGYYGNDKWNISLRCEAGLVDNDAGGTVPGLALYKFANRENAVTGKKYSKPIQIEENNGVNTGPVCMCSQVLKYGYQQACIAPPIVPPATAVKSYHNNYAKRSCSAPVTPPPPPLDPSVPTLPSVPGPTTVANTRGPEFSDDPTVDGGALGKLRACGGSASTADTPYQTILITSSNIPTNLGDLVNYDIKCKEFAETENLAGTWKAIMSNTSENARDRIILSGELRNTRNTRSGYSCSGEKIADDGGDLWNGNVDSDVDYYENGSRANGVYLVMTGSNSNGYSLNNQHCDDWSSTSQYDYFRAGDSRRNDYRWINAWSRRCNESNSRYRRILCINGQDEP